MDLISFILFCIVVVLAVPEMLSWRGTKDRWAAKNGLPPVDGQRAQLRPGAPPFYEYMEDNELQRTYPEEELYESIYASIGR